MNCSLHYQAATSKAAGLQTLTRSRRQHVCFLVAGSHPQTQAQTQRQHQPNQQQHQQHQQHHQQQQRQQPSRRTLLLGTAALCPAWLVSSARPVAAEALQDELESILGAPTSTPTPSAAAPAAGAGERDAGTGAAAPPPAAPSAAGAPGEPLAPTSMPAQVATSEGTIRLRTYDEATSNMTPTDKQIFTLNRRVQAQNRAPDDFPGFIREGFDITVVGEGYQIDPTNGLIYKDFLEGRGTSPADGQQVVFDYAGYNESGAIIDTSFRKGRPAEVRLGINGLIPGFELGIKGMKAGGRRRIVVPPALGPPVGPSTFFSAKQCEVFDVELRAVKSCQRRQMAMFSDVVCE